MQGCVNKHTPPNKVSELWAKQHALDQTGTSAAYPTRFTKDMHAKEGHEAYDMISIMMARHTGEVYTSIK
jgi:hypothetical protein